MAGFMDKAREWMTPERAAAFQGIGLGFSQLGAGQPVDLSPAYEALQTRKDAAQMRKVMEVPGVMDRFTPQQRAVLASMPEQLATKIIMETAFAPPAAPTELDTFTGPDGTVYSLDPISGKTTPLTGAKQPDPGYRFLTPEEVAANPRLNPSTAWQVGPDGKVSEVGGGGVTVNLGPNGVDFGEPAAGLVWQRNPDGTVMLDERGAPVAIPYKGGPAWQDEQATAAEAEAAAAADAAKTANTTTAGNVVLEDIGRFKDVVKNAPWYNPATGFGAGYLSEVGGTNAANAKQLSQTIRANIGFDRLQQMREASPTGGALGQVAVQELDALQSVLGSLSQAQTEEQLLENLDRLNVIYTEIMRKAAAYPNAAEFGIGSAPELSDDDLLKQYGGN